jgi:hypothetical protein
MSKSSWEVRQSEVRGGDQGLIRQWGLAMSAVVSQEPTLDEAAAYLTRSANVNGLRGLFARLLISCSEMDAFEGG